MMQESRDALPPLACCSFSLRRGVRHALRIEKRSEEVARPRRGTIVELLPPPEKTPQIPGHGCFLLSLSFLLLSFPLPFFFLFLVSFFPLGAPCPEDSEAAVVPCLRCVASRLGESTSVELGLEELAICGKCAPFVSSTGSFFWMFFVFFALVARHSVGDRGAQNGGVPEWNTGQVVDNVLEDCSYRSWKLLRNWPAKCDIFERATIYGGRV